jgi:hypothetical protein
MERMPLTKADGGQQPRPPGRRAHGLRVGALREIGFDGYLAMECAVRGDAETVLPQVTRRLRSLMT